MVIPPDLDREGVEHYRLQVEQVLNRLTCEAEAWAQAGTPKVDEIVERRQGAWLNLHRDLAHEPPTPHWPSRVVGADQTSRA
jgi:hypothetical protein